MWFYRWLRPKQIRRLLESQRPGRRGEGYRISEGSSAWSSREQRAEVMLRGREAPAANIAPEMRPGSTLIDGRLIFEIDAELSSQLWLAARLQDMAPETLATELLARGIEQEAFRAQAEAALATLTPREQEITWLTVRGHTNRQIAEALVISPETVKTHMRHVLDKFNVRSKADLRLLFTDLGVRLSEG